MPFGTLGIALASGSAAAFNHVLDRRIDEQMARTLGLLVNVLTAALTFCSLIGYAMVYTMWLERATPHFWALAIARRGRWT